MIHAIFFLENGSLVGFDVSGHAGFSEAGYDIVCAGVSSTLQLTANAITEILQVPVKLQVEENRISLLVPDQSETGAALFIKAFFFHLGVLQEDYPEFIEIITKEVFHNAKN